MIRHIRHALATTLVQPRAKFHTQMARHRVAPTQSIPPALRLSHCQRRSLHHSTSPALFSSNASRLSSSPTSSTSDLYRSPLRSSEDIDDNKELWESRHLLTRDAAGEHKYTLIWLHGLGERARKLETLCEIIAAPHMRIVVPQAPKLALTAMPHEPDTEMWFDVLTDKLDAEEEIRGNLMEEDEYGIEEMSARIHRLIDHELSTSPSLTSRSIILAGFGHGASMALHAGLCYPRPLAGLISIAGYVAMPHLYPSQLHEPQRHTPILVVHGAKDLVIPWTFAEARYQKFETETGIKLERRTEKQMGNFISNTALMGTQAWLTDTFEKAAAAALPTSK